MLQGLWHLLQLIMDQKCSNSLRPLVAAVHRTVLRHVLLSLSVPMLHVCNPAEPPRRDTPQSRPAETPRRAVPPMGSI